MFQPEELRHFVKPEAAINAGIVIYFMRPRLNF
jgi:hypothetical protein